MAGTCADDAWELLGKHIVGSLATGGGGTVGTYPITSAVGNKTIVFQPGPGTKLMKLTVNDKVAFEIDNWDDTEGYSARRFRRG